MNAVNLREASGPIKLTIEIKEVSEPVVSTCVSFHNEIVDTTIDVSFDLDTILGFEVSTTGNNLAELSEELSLLELRDLSYGDFSLRFEKIDQIGHFRATVFLKFNRIDIADCHTKIWAEFITNIGDIESFSKRLRANCLQHSAE